MKECRFCKGIIKDTDAFCKVCGYDPKTDRVSPDFIQPSEQERLRMQNKKNVSLSGGGISPGVKKFAFIGLAILVFSIFYKNCFNIENVIAEVKHTFVMISKGKFSIIPKKQSQKIQYLDVGSYKEN